MAYDEKLAQRIRSILAGKSGLTEKKMFGGLCFLLQGNMCCGVNKDELFARFDPKVHEEALSRPHVRPFDFSGRPMKGYVVVGAKGIASDADLKEWLDMGVKYALSLPGK